MCCSSRPHRLFQWNEPSMVVLVFDVCAESSFNNLTLWLEQYRGLKPGCQVRGVVVGTKCDKSTATSTSF